jgi:hypothetical protein
VEGARYRIITCIEERDRSHPRLPYSDNQGENRKERTMIHSTEKGGKLVTTYGDDRGIPQLTYTNIPNYILMVLFTMKLSRPEWKLYLYLRKLKNSNSATAWPPVRTIVRDAHIDINSVKPARDRLEKLGLISARVLPGIGVEISFNDEAILEIAGKYDQGLIDKLPWEKDSKDEKDEVLGTDHNTMDDAPEMPENDPEEEVSVMDSPEHTVMDSPERSVMDSAETINTNINTISITTTNPGEEEKEEEEEVLSLSAPATASEIPDAIINRTRGVMDSPEHLDDAGDDDEDVDGDGEEEDADADAYRIEQRRERMISWYGKRWADIPQYDPAQEERPYIEQFLLMYDNRNEAREALMAALHKWDSLHAEGATV